MDALLDYTSDSEIRSEPGPTASDGVEAETSTSDSGPSEADYPFRTNGRFADRELPLKRLFNDISPSQDENADALPASVPLQLENDKRIGTYPIFVYAALQVPWDHRPEIGAALSDLQRRIPELKAVEPVRPPNSSKKPAVMPESQQGTIPPSVPESLLRDEYHISLSRPATIPYSQIDGLVMGLREHLECALSSFSTKFQRHSRNGKDGGSLRQQVPLEIRGWEVFSNDDKSKSFISSGLSQGSGRSAVIKAIRAVDKAFLAYNLPLYYSDPMPHVSLAWLHGDRTDDLRVATRKYLLGFDEQDDTNSRIASSFRWTSSLDEISCMIGERIYVVWPPDAAEHTARKRHRQL